MKVIRVVAIALLSIFMLAGCVQYDVGVNFESQTKGEIVQHIKLGDKIASFSSDTIQEWLNSVERRVRSLEGKTKRLSSQEILVTIPFNNGAELEKKFNQFYNPVELKKNQPANTIKTDLPKFDCHLTVKQNNFLLLLRNQISLKVDLRSLSLISSNGNILVSPGGLLELEFSLKTPWGVRSLKTVENAIVPESFEEGQQLVWKLKPGAINSLEAIFWLPSPVGIGAVIIAIFVAVGIYLKYKVLPAFGFGKRQATIGQKA